MSDKCCDKVKYYKDRSQRESGAGNLSPKPYKKCAFEQEFRKVISRNFRVSPVNVIEYL